MKSFIFYCLLVALIQRRIVSVFIENELLEFIIYLYFTYMYTVLLFANNKCTLILFNELQIL